MQWNRQCVKADSRFSLCMILLSLLFSSFSSSLCSKSRGSIHKTDGFLFVLLWLFFIQIVCHDYHVNLCLKLHELFWLPHGILTFDYVVHASITRFSVSIGVCQSYGTKQMLHSVHIQTLWSVHTTYASTYTRISILTGKLDLNCT